MSEIFTLHPSMFERKGLNSLLALTKLKRLGQQKKPIRFAFDNRLGKAYLAHLNNGIVEKPLVSALIGDILRYQEPIQESLDQFIPDEIQPFLTDKYLTKTERILVKVACATGATIMINDNDASLGLSNKQTRGKISTALKKGEVIYASEFIRPEPIVFTEGKTDWRHMKAAYNYFKSQGKFLGWKIIFDEDDEARGCGELLQMCKRGVPFAKHMGAESVWICIFDRDDPKILDDVRLMRGKSETPRDWENGMYSFVLTIPKHRPKSGSYLCTEFLYPDCDLYKREKISGRRLYTSDEFDPTPISDNLEPGKKKYVHRSEGVFCRFLGGKSGIQFVKPVVSDDAERVHKHLNKIEFADYVFDQVAPFDLMNYEAFETLFNTIISIATNHIV